MTDKASNMHNSAASDGDAVGSRRRDGSVIVVEFVMVRGPASLPRRLRVRLPRDSTPVTLGRSPECDVVLDPLLVFASHVHCSVYCIVHDNADVTAVTAATTTAKADDDTDDGTAAEAARAGAVADMHTPLQPTCSTTTAHTTTTAAATPRGVLVQLFMTDMCSSNGTFVNGVRIGSRRATPLHNGDVCIFGGMRDVAEGSALPDDAFVGPELVVWRTRVRGCRGSATCTAADGGNNTAIDDDAAAIVVDDDDADDDESAAYALDATPLVLPSVEALRLQEQMLLETVQNSLRQLRGEAMCDADDGDGNDANKDDDGNGNDKIDDDDEHATVLSVLHACADQQQQQQQQQQRSRSCSADESGSHSGRRSLSIVATPQDTTTTTTTLVDAASSASLPQPPHSVCFCVVRMGKHTYRVPDSIRQQQRTASVHTDATATATAARGGRGRRPARKRTRAAADAAVTATSAAAAAASTRASSSPPCSITFTSTHWHWTMDDPNVSARDTHNDDDNNDTREGDGTAASAADTTAASPQALFHCMLPIRSIETLLVCAPRHGVAVELRDGCHVPLVAPAVMRGGVEQHWVVWQLCCTPHENNNNSNDDINNISHVDEDGKENDTRDEASNKSKGATRCAAASTGAAAASVSAHDAWFAAWLAQLAAYYAPYGVPTPHHVAADVFDKLLSPPAHTWSSSSLSSSSSSPAS